VKEEAKKDEAKKDEKAEEVRSFCSCIQHHFLSQHSAAFVSR